ncbi:MAG: hypothetical protein RLN70_04795, partial [Rhodospirillaceae bacterium]
MDRIAIKSRRMGLQRFACYCSFMRIPPDQDHRDSLLGFHAALDAEDVVKDPRKTLKHTIALWNMCRRTVPGWPNVVLSSPFKGKPFALELTDFPMSFQADIDRWAKRVSKPDPFDPRAPAKPLKPATLKTRIMEIRRFASALIERGELTVAEVTGLSVFFQRDRFKSGLRYFLDRSKGQSTPCIEAMANHLRHIAKHYCQVDEAMLEDLALTCRRLDCGSSAKLSERNRKRLRQFDDPDKVERLLAFPAEERARASRIKNPVRAARCMERALAIDLLIHCTLRIQNLR